MNNIGRFFGISKDAGSVHSDINRLETAAGEGVYTKDPDLLFYALIEAERIYNLPEVVSERTAMRGGVYEEGVDHTASRRIEAVVTKLDLYDAFRYAVTGMTPEEFKSI